MPPPTTVRVTDCLAKLQFLARSRLAAERGGYATNWKAFATRIAQCRQGKGLEVPSNIENYRNTLESAAKNDNLDSDTELIIAGLCRINTQSPAWRGGSFDQFKKDFEGAEFERQPLGGWSVAPEISVELFFSTQKAAAAWPCDVVIGCQPAKIEEVGQTVTITRAKLALAWDTKKFAETVVSSLEERETALATHAKKLAAKSLSCDPHGGNREPGWWFSNTEGLRLGIVSLDDICCLSEISEGLQVDARLIVEDRDLRAIDAANNMTVADDDGDPIRRRDGSLLGENKRKVLQAITVRSLAREPGQRPGTAILAIDRVVFKKK